MNAPLSLRPISAGISFMVPTLFAINASADPFQFLGFEAGGGLPDIAGAGFQSSAGEFFTTFNPQAPLATPFIFFGAFPEFEFETYFGADARGPSAWAGSVTAEFYDYGDQYETNSVSTPFELTLAPGSMITNGLAQAGVGISPQPFISGTSPDSRDGVFVMRATVSAGETVLGGGIFSIAGDEFQVISAEVNLDGTSADFEGQELGLVSYLVADASQNEGLGDTYDIWFQVVPSPGTLMCWMLVLGATSHRRRRASCV